MNKAPDWFPDWSEAACVVVASGPSAKNANLSALRGKMRVIAIKENVDLCPWAEVVYGCDAAWWIHRRGLPSFKGIKVVWEARAVTQFQDIRRIDLDHSQDKIYPVERRQYRMMFDRPGLIGSGANSGFQAINLAVQFGARKILLVGFDMHDRSGIHWYGKNTWFKGNPDESCFARWRAALHAAAPDLEKQGVHVLNASPVSELKCFGRTTIEQALSGWGL